MPPLVVVAWLTATTAALAQGPQFDVTNPPGIRGAESMVGPALGASGALQDMATEHQPISGRVGPSVTRAPASAFRLRTDRVQREGLPDLKVPAIPEAKVPAYGNLDLPEGEVHVGPSDGRSLNETIGLLMERNLGLMAMKYEIPMADADVLTSSLRANPIFYADSQLIPYGRFSNAKPGGQTQYDVNITHPLDVNGKRKARIQVATLAKRVVEAQFQDAVRMQVDNLFTAFVDVAAAELTREYSAKYLEGVEKLLKVNEELFEKKQVPEGAVLSLRAQLEVAQLQLREAQEAIVRTTRTLSQLLNIPREQALALRIQDNLRDDRPLPSSEEELIGIAVQSRPDLAAMRIAVDRANADVKLAHRERLSDLYLLYQPYTLQDNRPFGLKSPMSWAVGLTAPMPIYNRNQGNIQRAKINVDQTAVELSRMERRVMDDVSDAVREFELSRQAVLETESEILPPARKVRDAAFRRWQAGETDILAFLDAQREFNERVRDYRDAVIRHRRATLDLDTAVGARLLP